MRSPLYKQQKIFYGYIIIVALWFVYSLNLVIPTYGSSVLNAKMVEDTGISSTTVGIVVGLCTLTQGLVGPFLGKMTRRFGVRGTLLIGTVLMGTGAFLVALLGANLVAFAAFYGVVMAAGMGIGGVVMVNSSVNLWFDKRKGLALALVLSSGGVGGFFLPKILNSIAQNSGWRSGWVLYGIFCVISLLIIFVFVVNSPADVGEVPDGRRYREKLAVKQGDSSGSLTQSAKKDPPLSVVLKSAEYYLLLMCNSAKYALYYAITGQIVLYLVQTGVHSEQAAAAISYFSLASTAGRLLSGFVSEEILSPRMRVCGSTALMGIVTIVMMVAPGAVTVAYICLAISGFALGISTIGSPVMIARDFGASNFTSVNGNLVPFNYVFGALGPALTGIIADVFHSYAIAYTIFGVLAIVTSVLLFRTPPPRFEEDTDAVM